MPADLKLGVALQLLLFGFMLFLEVSSEVAEENSNEKPGQQEMQQ
jgi:hypothetical protein